MLPTVLDTSGKTSLRKSIHICILSSSRLFESSYGEEKFSMTFAEWLYDFGCDVSLIGSTLTGVSVRYLFRQTKPLVNGSLRSTGATARSKVRTYHVPHIVYMLSRIYLSMLWSIKILNINKRKRIDLIHAQDTGYAGLAAVVMGKLLRIPVIISSHGIRHKTIESSLLKINRILLSAEYKLDLFTIRNCDACIVVNQFMKDYYYQRVKKEINVVPTALNVAEFTFSNDKRSTFRKEINVTDGVTVIGYIGRLANEKNIIGLIHSFESLSRVDKNLHLVIVGGGPLEQEINDLVTSKNLKGRITMCGLRTDISTILSGIDIFVLPSFVEGLSYSLLEAMASERPIVCSDIPANRGLLEDYEDAIFIDPYKQEEIGKALKFLVNNPGIRSDLAHKSRNKVSIYDYSVIFPKIVEIYRKYLLI